LADWEAIKRKLSENADTITGVGLPLVAGLLTKREMGDVRKLIDSIGKVSSENGNSFASLARRKLSSITLDDIDRVYNAMKQRTKQNETTFNSLNKDLDNYLSGGFRTKIELPTSEFYNPSLRKNSKYVVNILNALPKEAVSTPNEIRLVTQASDPYASLHPGTNAYANWSNNSVTLVHPNTFAYKNDSPRIIAHELMHTIANNNPQAYYDILDYLYGVERWPIHNNSGYPDYHPTHVEILKRFPSYEDIREYYRNGIGSGIDHTLWENRPQLSYPKSWERGSWEGGGIPYALAGGPIESLAEGGAWALLKEGNLKKFLDLYSTELNASPERMSAMKRVLQSANVL